MYARAKPRGRAVRPSPSQCTLTSRVTSLHTCYCCSRGPAVGHWPNGTVTHSVSHSLKITLRESSVPHPGCVPMLPILLRHQCQLNIHESMHLTPHSLSCTATVLTTSVNVLQFDLHRNFPNRERKATLSPRVMNQTSSNEPSQRNQPQSPSPTITYQLTTTTEANCAFSLF